MTVYDIHTHIFPDKVAAKGVANIGGYYGIPMQCDGKASTLDGIRLPEMKCCISSAALKEEIVTKNNDFLLEEAGKYPAFIPFSSFYPFMSPSEAAKELERVKSLGSKGIKMHPDFQKYNIDEPNAVEIYRICAELELPVLFHVGDRNTDYSTPVRVLNVAEKVPSLKIIAAHMCGYSVWDDAEKYLIGTNVYTETSDALLDLEPERVLGMIRRHGVDKVMFGSDFPLSSPRDAFEKLDAIGLTAEEKLKIYQTNAEKLFGL